MTPTCDGSTAQITGVTGGTFAFVDEPSDGAVIDANTFKADIFVKPARSINFIGLTFVATRTGISFDEVVGSA